MTTPTTGALLAGSEGVVRGDAMSVNNVTNQSRIGWRGLQAVKWSHINLSPIIHL